MHTFFAKLALAALLSAAAFGCQSGVTVLMDRRLAMQAGVGLEGPVAMDSAGRVYVTSKGLPWRYDAKSHSFEQLSPLGVSPSREIAVNDEDVVLVLNREGVCAVAGKTQPLVAKFPGNVYRICWGNDALYAVTARDKNKHQVLRYRFSTRKTETLLEAETPMLAIVALDDGLLVSGGESIYKVSISPATSGETAVTTSFVCGITGANITAIAADPAHKVFYFSDGTATFFWANGKVRQLLPTGGGLALRDDQLVISSAVQGQLLRVDRVWTETRKVLDADNIIDVQK